MNYIGKLRIVKARNVLNFSISHDSYFIKKYYNNLLAIINFLQKIANKKGMRPQCNEEFIIAPFSF